MNFNKKQIFLSKMLLDFLSCFLFLRIKLKLTHNFVWFKNYLLSNHEIEIQMLNIKCKTTNAFSLLQCHHKQHNLLADLTLQRKLHYGLPLWCTAQTFCSVL